jgi:hypothetical protein
MSSSGNSRLWEGSDNIVCKEFCKIYD